MAVRQMARLRQLFPLIDEDVETFAGLENLAVARVASNHIDILSYRADTKGKTPGDQIIFLSHLSRSDTYLQSTLSHIIIAGH